MLAFKSGDAGPRPRSWIGSREASPTRRSRRSPPGSGNGSEPDALASQDVRRGHGAAWCGCHRPAGRAQSTGRVVVVGGGFAGATCARELRRGGVDVTLVEPQTVYTACPMSNAVVAGLRGIEKQRFGYDALRQHGIAVVHAAVAGIEADRREAVLVDGTRIAFDRLVLAPGIDLRFDAPRATTRRRPRSCRTPGRPDRRPSCCGVSWRRCPMAARSS